MHAAAAYTVISTNEIIAKDTRINNPIFHTDIHELLTRFIII